MKKIFLAAAIAALAATAFANGYGFGGGYGMMGGGYGAGYGMMGQTNGNGFGPGGCPGPFFQNNGDADGKGFPAAIDEEGAKKLVQEYLDENLKGFSITGTEKYAMPRGNMYRFELKDESGNKFLLAVNPFGYIMGPVVANN
jgi:hypothetical protein